MKIAKLALLLFFALFFTVFGTFPAAAVEVSPLPGNNLVQNPWIELNSPEEHSGWIDEGEMWGVSYKVSNPGRQERGYSARFADRQVGEGAGRETIRLGGQDGYIYTVVQAPAGARNLSFKTHYVSLNIVIAEVTIYGGASQNGPWEAVWTPFTLTPENEIRFIWQESELFSTEIETPFPFYKIEYHARYKQGSQWGFKFTGVYFSAGGSQLPAHGGGEPYLTPGGRRPFNGYMGVPRS